MTSTAAPITIWHTPLSRLPGVGQRRAEVLSADLELHTYLDLLHYFPYRYIDRSRIYTISEISGDMPYVQLRGTLRHVAQAGSGRKRRLQAVFHDGTGSIELVWFKNVSQIERSLALGRPYLIFGRPTFFNGTYTIAHPEMDNPDKATHLTGGLVPMYTIPESMKRSGITQRVMRTLVATLLQQVRAHIAETLPPEITDSYRLMPYAQAIEYVHYPQHTSHLDEARRRLKFEELFFLQLKMQLIKYKRKVTYHGFRFPKVGHYFNTFYKQHIPFPLTEAQKRVVREVHQDTLTGKQMNRLVQGDVGSGKTLVSLLCMLLALDNDTQACMMAPTEILARQHHHTLSRMLAPMGIEVGLLVGSSKQRERNELLPALASGHMRIVVGTHALLEPSVVFHQLGLAVIDEQHRFGVEQRARLWRKNDGLMPHILIMSATPIPRTLAMTLYGDLDISVIDELPPGRKPITTYHQFDNNMGPVYQFIRKQIAAGHQAYVVYPMINESEDYKSLEEGYNQLTEIFPDIPLTWVHGRLTPSEKEMRMRSFAQGQAKILLATTVIEVGVDVPNATVMIIEGAERFGLSQLHQLRGRVGRGAAESYCVLVTPASMSEDTKRRMEIMVETNDGFRIAEEDMRLRGMGEIDGTRQSGRMITLRIANPATDGALVQMAHNAVQAILDKDEQLQTPYYAPLLSRLNLLIPLEADWSAIS